MIFYRNSSIYFSTKGVQLVTTFSYATDAELFFNLLFLPLVIYSVFSENFVTRYVLQSFFIGGGSNPSSVLAGFDHTTLSTALNVHFLLFLTV